MHRASIVQHGQAVHRVECVQMPLLVMFNDLGCHSLYAMSEAADAASLCWLLQRLLQHCCQAVE
jgi:hypothetical protein